MQKVKPIITIDAYSTGLLAAIAIPAEGMIRAENNLIAGNFLHFCKRIENTKTENKKDLSKEALLNICERLGSAKEFEPMSFNLNECFLISALLIFFYWIKRSKLDAKLGVNVNINITSLADEVFFSYATSFSSNENETFIVMRDYIIYNSDDYTCCKGFPFDPAISDFCNKCENRNYEKTRATSKLCALLVPA